MSWSGGNPCIPNRNACFGDAKNTPGPPVVVRLVEGVHLLEHPLDWAWGTGLSLGPQLPVFHDGLHHAVCAGTSQQWPAR